MLFLRHREYVTGSVTQSERFEQLFEQLICDLRCVRVMYPRSYVRINSRHTTMSLSLLARWRIQLGLCVRVIWHG